MPDTFIKLPKPRVQERSGISLTAYFRNSSHTATAPTTAKYRIDCLTTKTAITPLTDLSTSTSITITVKSSENKIVDNSNAWERRQITVFADKGTDNETRDTATWRVMNNGGFEE